MAEQFRRTIPGCEVQTVLGSRHDVFLGPGAEQAFGAIGLFLLRLASGDSERAQLALPGTAEEQAAAQLGLAGGLAAEPREAGLNVIERTVAAINARDDRAIESVFLPDGRFTLVAPDGTREEGGADAARAGLDRLLEALPGATVSARNLVLSADGAAAILTVRSPGVAGEAMLMPAFAQVRDGRIAGLTVFAVRTAPRRG
ncbi:MAG: nuclear transport factor 2 family protein [Chloroflexota bacterium]